ncbi:MAG: hypothetical protein IKY83_07150, partial [Proteobacteria bacterium]|nr:hypothetical protein [Pseudomonadota bacterium]
IRGSICPSMHVRAYAGQHFAVGCRPMFVSAQISVSKPVASMGDHTVLFYDCGYGFLQPTAYCLQSIACCLPILGMFFERMAYIINRKRRHAGGSGVPPALCVTTM